jgi:hypothetical protein
MEAAVYAVVRMPSHGASATVIYTSAGQSYLLGCSHAFYGETIHKPIQLDVPASDHRASKAARCILIDIDYATDLSLMELSDGPLDFHADVAPADYVCSSHLLSVGYDEMRTPATVKTATITRTMGKLTFTQEKPWHGRSGGALLDAETGYLIGVVQGYELLPGGRGIYSSHQAIIKFLRRKHELPEHKLYRPLSLNPFDGLFQR